MQGALLSSCGRAGSPGNSTVDLVGFLRFSGFWKGTGEFSSAISSSSAVFVRQLAQRRDADAGERLAFRALTVRVLLTSYNIFISINTWFGDKEVNVRSARGY